MALVAGLLALALGLGGCSSDDPKPKVAPPESSSPTVSDSPTTAPSTDSPEDVVRAWVDAQNLAMRGGDSSKVRALSASPCEACDGLIDPIDDVYAAGGYFKTKGWSVSSLKQDSATASRAKVNTAIVIAGGKTLNAKGQEPVTYGVERSIVVFRLVRQEQRWLVSFIGFLS